MIGSFKPLLPPLLAATSRRPPRVSDAATRGEMQWISKSSLSSLKITLGLAFPSLRVQLSTDVAAGQRIFGWRCLLAN